MARNFVKPEQTAMFVGLSLFSALGILLVTTFNLPQSQPQTTLTRSQRELEKLKEELLVELEKKEAEIKALNQRAEHPRKQIEQPDRPLKKQLLKISTFNGNPAVESVITEADDNQITVPMGSNDGMRAGLTFDVYRYLNGKKLFVGMVTIVDVGETESKAKPMKGASAMKPDDRVAGPVIIAQNY